MPRSQGSAPPWGAAGRDCSPLLPPGNLAGAKFLLLGSKEGSCRLGFLQARAMPAGDHCHRIMGPLLTHQHRGEAEPLVSHVGDAHILRQSPLSNDTK